MNHSISVMFHPLTTNQPLNLCPPILGYRNSAKARPEGDYQRRLIRSTLSDCKGKGITLDVLAFLGACSSLAINTANAMKLSHSNNNNSNNNNNNNNNNLNSIKVVTSSNGGARKSDKLEFVKKLRSGTALLHPEIIGQLFANVIKNQKWSTSDM